MVDIDPAKDQAGENPATSCESPEVAECKGCAHLWNAKTFWAIRTPKIQDLTTAAETGCVACALLLQGIGHYGGTRSLSEPVALQYGSDSSGAKTLRVKLLKEPPVSLTFYRAPDSEIDAAAGVDGWPKGYSVPRSTTSDESLRWVLALIDQCKTHKECRVEAQPLLPARVISISDHDPQDIKLRVTNGERGTYTCLSHCWGSDPDRVPKTLKSNVQAHQVRIPWGGISIRFQEAIAFTWTLGIRNIWIDSLCIIQDDNADWQVQGAQMGSIYSNSFLTISAVHSSNADVGLFSAANSAPEAYELSLPGKASSSQLFCRPELSHIKHREGRLIESEEIQLDFMSGVLRAPESKFLNTPLVRRAWVLQERLLSPRVLHFGKEELSWECVEHCACQCSESLHYGGLAERILDANEMPIKHAEGKKSELNPKREYSPAALASLLAADGALAVCKRWIWLVQEYSTLQLTYKSDVFPALSGLAKAFAQTLDAKYYAGIFEGFVQIGLLWKVTGRGGRSGPWKAPSWSWASVDTPVRYMLRDVEEELLEQCQVLEVSCSPAASDPTAQLTAGYVVLRGILFAAEVKHQSGRMFHGDVITFDFMRNRSGTTSADYDMTLPGPGYVPEGSLLYCLLVGKGSRWKQSFLLVLKEAVGGCDNRRESVVTYERVGAIEVPEWRGDGIDRYSELVKQARETTVRID